MKENKLDTQFGTWLGDSGDVAKPEGILNSLDRLYKSGPGTEATLQAKSNLRKSIEKIENECVYYDSITHSLIGTIFIAKTAQGLLAVEFGITENDFVQRMEQEGARVVIRSSEKTVEERSQLREYLNGKRTSFDIDIDLSALTEFHQQVLMAAWEIPHGRIVTYGEIARRIGKPKAARAVGQALGRNPVPIVIPCHRVISSDGSLGGYSGGGGLETKTKLLELENSTLL
jgi:methylated-DNA-[protein]-cysteine S-methyltransferase